MMDVPTASQNQTPCQLWVSPASTQEPPCIPLPGFQHLGLSSPADQRSCYDSLQASNQGCCSGVTTAFGSEALQTLHHPNSNDQTVKQFIPNAHLSSTGSAANQGRGKPPCSLPLPNTRMQLYKTHQNPINSTHNQAICSPLQPSYTNHNLLNGPQSPSKDYLPNTSPEFGLCVNQNHQCSPQPAFGKRNTEASVGYMNNFASPTSPIQHHPPWELPSHSLGNINSPTSTEHERDITAQSPNSESRYGLNPELLPSAVKVTAQDQAEWEGKVFVSEPFSHLPPLATTSCITEDRGSASPLAIRSTTYCVPCDGQTALLSRLPLGALVTPLAKRNAGEKPLPVCKEPECIKGCGWCGASMCPAMSWLDCGQRFHCPFCGKLSEVVWQHYQPTEGVEGARVDKDLRPELSMGSYEILSSQKVEPAALLLAIDVSPSALTAGHLEFVTQQLRTLLSSLKREDGDSLSDVRVGLMTYDSKIHLYDLSPALSRPHMLVITETEELQLPVREGLLVPLKDCMDSIDSVLQLILRFSPERDDSSGVPVELSVKAGLAILQELSCPGKLLIFHAAPLTEMRHSNRSSGLFGSNKSKSIFQPSDQAISLAKECVSQGCGIHMFVLSQQDVGGAWPGHIPYLTGGSLHTYSQLQGELDRERFSSDLRRTVETDTAYKADLRIFVSKDLRVSGCYGLFIPGTSPKYVTMATVNWFTTLAVELAHTRALEEMKGVTIQAVLSYSTQTGNRRTRVHTLTLRCSNDLQETSRQYQAQTLLGFYCRKIYCAVLERPLLELRQELQMDVTEALASYRKHCCSASVSAGQLVLPQYLRALPVYVNSLRKSEVLLPGLRTSIHQRLHQRCQVLSMDTCNIVAHFYPLLLPLPLSVDSFNSPNREEALRCSATSLEPAGLYLIHAPLTLLLWVGAKVPARTLVELFSTSCFSSLPSGETKLPVLENPLSTRIRSLISRLNAQVPSSRKLWVVKQGDSCEEALQRHLVEDKSPNGGASYADFLYHLHVNSVRLLH